jgi:hypothetical protein
MVLKFLRGISVEENDAHALHELEFSGHLVDETTFMTK